MAPAADGSHAAQSPRDLAADFLRFEAESGLRRDPAFALWCEQHRLGVYASALVRRELALLAKTQHSLPASE